MNLLRTTLLSAVFAAALGAQDTRPAESRPARPPEEWILELDADDFARRDAAAEALVSAGEAARAALESARDSGSLERRIRVGELLGRLGVKTAASRPAKTRSIDLSGKTLAEACEALETAFGRRMRTASGADAALGVDVKLVDAGFFQAVDAVCTSAGAAFYRDARDGAFVLRASPEKPGPVVYAEGVRVSLTQLSVSRIKRFGGATSSSAFLQLQIDADPDAAAVGVMAPVTIAEAIDDQGRSLVPKNAAQASYVQRLDQTGRVPVAAQLNAPETDAKSIKKLRLDLRVVLPEKTAEVEIATLSADPDRQYGDGALKVAIDEWRETEEGVSVKLTLDRPAPVGEGPPQSNVFDDRIVFVSSDGTIIDPRTTGMRNLVGKGQFQAELPKGSYSAIRVSCLVSYVVRDVVASFEEIALP